MNVYADAVRPDCTTHEVERVQAILRSYFDALEDGSIDSLLPAPVYRWRYWIGGLSVERMRKGLENIDEYLSEGGQHQWAENNAPDGRTKFDAGPDLSRLPDAALVSMFQELDAALAGKKGR